MVMDIKSKRGRDGSLSPKTILNRFNNLLNIIYLGSERLSDGAYKIPEKVFELIQTELDFNPPKEGERTKKEKLEAQKSRYRKRETYSFWRDILLESNYINALEAERVLLRVYSKLDDSRAYGSMTHCRYALETLHLAIDDFYGTKKAQILTPSWVAESFKTNKPKAIKGTSPPPKSQIGKKPKGAKTQKTVEEVIDLYDLLDEVPF
jgi:hypothetical protein